MKRNVFAVGTGLYLLTIISQLANIAYEAYVNQNPILPLLLPSILFLSVLTVPALLIGFGLGRDLGLVPFDEQNAITQPSTPTNPMLFSVVSGVLLGALLLVLRWLLLPYLPDEIPAYGFRGFIGGVLVSFGAAVGEEVWFRFGLMTLVLWLTKKWFKLEQLSNQHALIVIILISVLFGLAHLPQLASFNADTQFAVWATILGNVAVGTLYGWCFWRFGLFYAILSHFVLDIVLHALPALF